MEPALPACVDKIVATVHGNFALTCNSGATLYPHQNLTYSEERSGKIEICD